MKNLYFLLLVLTGICFFSCDDNTEIDCYSGTVLEQVSCSSESGAAFLIEVTEQKSTYTFATTTLPDIYKKEGEKIYFKRRETKHPLICTTHIIPPNLDYDIYNVSDKPCLCE